MIEHYNSMVSSGSSIVPPLNVEEEMFCATSVDRLLLKLMQKYKKEEGKKAMQFMKCLSNMTVEGEESSFYNYGLLIVVDFSYQRWCLLPILQSDQA